MNLVHSEFFAVALIHFLAVASPGPDFAIVLRHSVSYGRKSGLWTSLGIGTAIFVHIAYCVLGLGILISKSIIAFNIVKYLGALYLVYVGIGAIRAKPMQIEESKVEKENSVTSSKSFWIGFITNVLNPKATLFFLAVFSVSVSPETPLLLKVGYGVWMAAVTTLWFSGLCLLFSKTFVRNLFKKFGHWFERSMGLVLIALGIRLALIRK
jgi:RhtB (resistance to homoserine/threonine) family protein